MSKHKVGINVPTEAEVKRLVAEIKQDGDNPLQDFWENFRNSLCDSMTSFGTQLGCGSSEQSSFVGSLCGMINGLLETVGCDPIPEEPEPECVSDSDCLPYENCVANFCVDDEEHCHNSGCEEYEDCNESSGECEIAMDRCEDNEDCTWDQTEQLCKVETNYCVECLEWQDCNPSGGEECNSNVCESCPPTGSFCDEDEDCCSYMNCNLDFNQCILP